MTDGYSGKKIIRTSAELTNAFVEAKILGASKNQIENRNQLILYVDFTLGMLTSMQMIVEFSPDNGKNRFKQTNIEISGGAITPTVAERNFTVTGKYRIAIPIKDDQIKVSFKGTGTVDDSLCECTSINGNA